MFNIFKLEKKHYSKVLQLIENIEHSKAMVFSVVQKKTEGNIFVDNIDTPSSTFIHQQGGFMYILSENEAFIKDSCDFIFNSILPGMIEKEIILFSFSDSSRSMLDESFKDRGIIRIERKSFEFTPHSFIQLYPSDPILPSGYTLKSMEEKDFLHFNVSRNLGNTITDKVGYQIVKGGDVASECASIFVGGKHAEIDISTSEIHRKKGLAEACAVAFIKKCLEKGLTPCWSCWPFREASISLAKKLCFREIENIPVHFWAENM